MKFLTIKQGLSPAMLASTDKTQKDNFIFKTITSFQDYKTSYEI